MVERTRGGRGGTVTGAPTPSLASRYGPTAAAAPIRIVAGARLRRMHSLVKRMLARIIARGGGALRGRVDARIATSIVHRVSFLFRTGRQRRRRRFHGLSDLVHRRRTAQGRDIGGDPMLEFGGEFA